MSELVEEIILLASADLLFDSQHFFTLEPWVMIAAMQLLHRAGYAHLTES